MIIIENSWNDSFIPPALLWFSGFVIQILTFFSCLDTYWCDSKRWGFEGTSCIEKFLVKMLRGCNISRLVLWLSEYSSNNMYFHHLYSEWHVKKILHNLLHLVHLSGSVALFQNIVWKQSRNLAWNLCLFFYMLMTLVSVYTWLWLIKL